MLTDDPCRSDLRKVSRMTNPSNLALHRVRAHKAYVPGEQPPPETKLIKLNTNENPHPPSPLVLEAIKAEAKNLRLYPDAKSSNLREALAELHGLSPDQVLAGNGSDDVLNLCARSFADADKPIGMTVPSYSLYPTLASLQGSPLVEVPFDESFSLDPERISSCGANLFYLTSPNAPTGLGFSNQVLSEILKSFEGILVVDEAYADFAEENAASLLSEFPRLLVVRTLSKSYGLAGLRVGFALGSPEVIGILDKVREVYNVDRLAQAAAIAAIKDQDYFQEVIGRVLATRTQLTEVFAGLKWKVYESSANFVFTEPRLPAGESGPEIAEDLFEYLYARNILVRRFPNHPLTSSFLRISIGDDDQMTTLNKTIEEWLKTA